MEFSTEAISKLLDFYPEQAALIDEHYHIVAANQSWSNSGLSDYRNNSRLKQSFCSSEDSFVLDPAHAIEVDRGIRRVLSGIAGEFSFSYENLLPERRSFRLTAALFSPSKNVRCALLLYLDLTDHQGCKAVDPITVCGWCRCIQERGNSTNFEEFFSRKLGMRFSHGICPECSDKVLSESLVSSGAAACVAAPEHRTTR